MAEDEGTRPEDEKAEEAAATPAASSTEESAEQPAVQNAAPKASAEKASAENASAEKASAEKASEDKNAASSAPGTPSQADDKKPRDIFAELDPAEKEQPKILKAKGSKNIHAGILHVRATFNNTMVTVTDMAGNTIGWSSAGKMGFRGSRKSTAYAGQIVSQDACRQAMSHGLKEIEVRVTGPGSGREAAVRAAQGLGLHIHTIKDVTPIPHNGCRPPKARRV